MDKQTIDKKTFIAAAKVGSVVTRVRQTVLVRTVGLAAVQFVACTLLARATIFGFFAPFGAAMAGALCAVGGGLAGVTGAFFGYLVLRSDAQGVAYAAAALLTLCTAHVFEDPLGKKRQWLMPLTVTLSTMGCVFAFLPDFSTYWLALFACTTLLTYGTTWFYIAALTPPKNVSALRRPTAFLVLAGTLLVSVSDFVVWGGASPARAAAVLCVLMVAGLGGGKPGAAAGVALGAAMDAFSGHGAFFTCQYALAALLAGSIRVRDRRLFAGLFLLGAGFAGMLGAAQAVFIPSLYEAAVAVVLFAAMPEALWQSIGDTFAPTEGKENAGDLWTRRRAAIRRTAGEASEAFYEMYLSMMAGVQYGKATASEDAHEIFRAASDRVCKRCAICQHCWQKDYVATLDTLNNVAVPMLKRGQAAPDDFPAHFSARCVHFPELLRAMNEAMFAVRERREYRSRQDENRSLLAKQYAGVTDILRSLGSEFTHDFASLPAKERQVKRYAVAFGKIDRVAVFRDGGGRLHVELSGEGVDSLLTDGKGFTAGLSALLGVRLHDPEVLIDELGRRVALREMAAFRAVVGMSKRQKDGERVSGDCGRYFVTDAGTACLILCDGMGTGEQAAADSAEMLSMMERFLRAGVSPEDALGAVAPAYRLRCDGRRFVTLDVLTIDLFSGLATAIKCGAAPSYLKTANGLTRLGGATLPIGLSEEDGPGDSVPLRLTHGDLFVMLSDGVCDGTEDDFVRQILIEANTPSALAAKLVAGASARGAADDMTALVLRIERV